MKVCVIGSRSITNKELVYNKLNDFYYDPSTHPLVILSGGAKGVDALAKQYAEEMEVTFIEFLPYHLLDNKVEFTSKYFFIRNKQMIDNADLVLAFWDGESKGTQYGIKYAQKKNIPYAVIKQPKSS